jgi:FMN phosphatase YigB (HAD superfamily)
VDRRRRIRAVLFDVDGTLYRQTTLRTLMAFELMTWSLAHPWQARRTYRVLSQYRRAQELLRMDPPERLQDCARRQLELAARHANVNAGDAEHIVSEWMFRRPLKYLPRCRAAGLFELLTFLAGRSIPVGVLSDYAAEAKLRALGVAQHVSMVICASDPDVGAVKPNPRGFLHACARWQFDPGDVLVVGDRVDADAAGAAAAGMPCVIIGRSGSSPHDPAGFLPVASFERLRGVLDDRC